MCKCGIHVCIYLFVHVWAHLHMCAHTCRGSVNMVIIPLNGCFPLFIEAGLSVKSRAYPLASLDSHHAWGSLVSPSQARNNRQATTIFPGICMYLGDPNSGPHVSVVSTLTAEQEQFHNSMCSSLYLARCSRKTLRESENSEGHRLCWISTNINFALGTPIYDIYFYLALKKNKHLLHN